MNRTFTLRELAPADPSSSPPDEDHVWLLNLDNIEPHTGRLLGETRVAKEEVGSSTHAFDEGNVLYSKLRPYLNKVYLPHSRGLCTSELVPLRPDTSKVTREYLAAYLRSPKFVRWVNQQIDGAKMPRVSMKMFWEHSIEVPPLEEQNRIVTILDKADSLLRKRQEAIELADVFLHAVFMRIARQSPERTSIESLMADVPNAIRTGPFGSQLLVSEFTESGIAVLGIDNVVTNRFTWNERRYISAEKYEQLARYTVFPGDVMITIMGTTGRVAIAPKELPRCISTKHLCTMTVNQEKITPEYLWASLRWDTDVRAQTAREGKGSIMEGWNMGIIKGLKVTRPPIHIQRKFSQALTQTRHITDLLMSSKLQGCALISSLSEILLNEGDPF